MLQRSKHFALRAGVEIFKLMSFPFLNRTHKLRVSAEEKYLHERFAFSLIVSNYVILPVTQRKKSLSLLRWRDE